MVNSPKRRWNSTGITEVCVDPRISSYRNPRFLNRKTRIKRPLGPFHPTPGGPGSQHRQQAPKTGSCDSTCRGAGSQGHPSWITRSSWAWNTSMESWLATREVLVGEMLTKMRLLRGRDFSLTGGAYRAQDHGRF
jgi:hypothetical protein